MQRLQEDTRDYANQPFGCHQGEEITFFVQETDEKTHICISDMNKHSFTGTLMKGQGVFAEFLVRNGIPVMDVEDLL